MYEGIIRVPIFSVQTQSLVSTEDVHKPFKADKCNMRRFLPSSNLSTASWQA